MMKQIGIKKQPRLGMVRTFSLTIYGIRYRIFRSAVTLVVVTVAIAFMMNVLSESVVKRAIIQTTSSRVRQKRIISEWTARLSVPSAPEQILKRVGMAESGDLVFQEAMGFGGLSIKEMRAYHQNAKQALAYLAFFEGLAFRHRLRLVHSATGVKVFQRLQNPGRMDHFATTLGNTRAIRFVGPVEDFQNFLEKWPELQLQTEKIRQGQAQAISQIYVGMGNRTVLEALVDGESSFGQTIRSAGFQFGERDAKLVAQQARHLHQKQALEQSINDSTMQKVLASYLDILPTEASVQKLWKFLSHKKSAGLYLKALSKIGFELGNLNAIRVVELADSWAEDAMLARAEQIGADIEGGLFGIGERMAWLVLISIVVCIVGIANVMLMSVTERFREIATLKCLGALDGFIMLSFMMEAFMVGILGGIAGSIGGILIGVGRMLFTFGPLLFYSFPTEALFQWMGVSILLGVILAVVASVYPSFKAARLAPMEAMRIE